MNRKEFLSASGKSIVGLSVLGQIPLNFFACGSPGKIQNSGGIMIEVKKRRLQLAHTWTISRNSSDFICLSSW